MSYFAQINSENKVIQVLNVDTIPNDGTWIETSFDTRYGQNMKGEAPLRKNFAATGFAYDSVRDAFIPSKQFQSWVLDEQTCNWIPPIPYPQDSKKYKWNELNVNWEEVV